MPPVKSHFLPSCARHLLACATLAISAAGCIDFTRPPNETQRMTRGNSLYVKGALAYQEGSRDRAVAALQSALQVNPDLIMARFLLGNIYKEQGEYAAAAEHYERVVELDPYVAANHYNLGLVNHLLNRLQLAAASYLQALQLNPSDMRSNMNLGLVYTALGKPDVALTYAQKAVDLDPRSAEAAANLGVVLDARGEYAAAERAYRRAIELDSDRIETAINLAGNLVSQQRYKEAISVYEQILRTPANDSTLLRQRYGYALLQAERPDESVQQFSVALKMNPQNYQAMNGMGDALLTQYRNSAMLDEKKRTGAVTYWKQSLALNPRQPRVAALVKEYSGTGLFP
jgi:tetratricopeptide (TPR) repeat protein